MKTRTFITAALSVALMSALSISSLVASAQSTEQGSGQQSAPVQNQESSSEAKPLRGPRHDLIKREVVKTANGVVITMTTEDAEELARLQAHTPPAPPYGKATVVKENIINGVRITISSNDAEEIKRIQEHSERGPGENRKPGNQVKGEKRHDCPPRFHDDNQGNFGNFSGQMQGAQSGRFERRMRGFNRNQEFQS